MQELNLQDILDNTSDLSQKRVWYAAIIGRPNAGKSTFINTLLGEKIAITSPVPQTTRNQIQAIYTTPESQIIFIDTPGIHESQKSFNEHINSQARSSLAEADVVVYFIDASRPAGAEESAIEELLEHIETPVIRVLTKSDLPQKSPKSDDALTLSNVTQEGYDELLEKISEYLPMWPELFPEDFSTRQSLNFRVSEMIREKAFEELKEELPHSIFISVEEIEDDTQKDMKKISAYIYTETESQKYIVIGKNGSQITRIGKAAREELEDFFGQKVFLQLRAKSKKNWRKDEKLLKKMFQ